MRTSILFGGPAGTGPNILTSVVGNALVRQGYYVFYSRDYQSLIRGGHNFNVLTFSEEPVSSNDSQIDVLVCLDKNTKNIHNKNLKEGGIILEGSEGNMNFAGRIFKILGLGFETLEEELRTLGKRVEENLGTSRKGYDGETREFCKLETKKLTGIFENGSQGIADGAIDSGMEIYYAYPMTPATPVLTEISQRTLDEKSKHLSIELENEIAVVNAGVGSAMTGKKVMVGTSGGGFDLMTEGLSLCGIAGIPLVFYLAQRPGPATGVATYTSQGDLKMALNAGHGEFTRIVVAPGNPSEAKELTSQVFYLSSKFKVPSIILSDKHLAESFYTSEGKGEIVKFKTDLKMKRFNSYETDEGGSATEEPEIIEKNIVARMKKGFELAEESKKFEMYKIYGEVSSKNLVVSWGSPKGAISDAVKDLDCGFLQIKYLEPFPKEVAKIMKDKNLILVENNSTGPLADLIREKTGILIEDRKKILRFDGRPFLADELKEEIGRRIK